MPMQNLEQILATLRQGTEAEATLPTLNKEMAEANALRGKPIAAVDEKTGYVSPFEAISGMIQQGRGAQQRRELKPQIAQAQQQVAGSKAGLQEYTLRNAMAKQERDIADKAAKAKATLDAATLLNTQKVNAANAKNTFQTEQDAQQNVYQTEQDAQQNTWSEQAQEEKNTFQMDQDINAENQKQLDRDNKLAIAKIRAANKAKEKGTKKGYYQSIGTAAQQKDFEELANETQNQISLFRQFKPEYGASGYVPLLGTASNIIAKQTPALASEPMIKKERFWRDFSGQYTNLKRHELFGSALTDGEKAAWAKSNVDENSSPEQIQDAMFTLEYLARKLAYKTSNNALIKGRDKEYVNANYGYMENYGAFRDLSEVPKDVESGEWEDLTYQERQQMFDRGLVQ